MPAFALKGYPNPRQEQFFRANARHIAYGGARGGGKSWAMRRKFVLLALRYPGLRLLLLRRTMPELRENHVVPLLAELAGVAKYSAAERAFVFPGGARLKLGYCEHEGDVYQYQGQEYDVIGLEEATHFSEPQMQFLTTCNRSTRQDFRPRMYYTANPGGPGHAWFKRLFIDRAYHGPERAEDYIFIPARVYDNAVLMQANPEYVRTLEALPEQMRKAHLDGDWSVFAGQVFSEWRADVHVVPAFEPPAEWYRFRALDWGFAKPYCVLWGAVDFDGRIWLYAELYGWGGRPDVGSEEDPTQVAAKIRQVDAGAELYGLADPSIFARPQSGGKSVEELFRAAGVFWQRADNDRLAGKMQVHHRLRPQADKQPMLMVMDCCAHLTRTLPALIYDSHKSEDVNTSQEDHAYDALRYLLMARPITPQVKIERTPLPFALRTDAEIRQEGKTWMSWE